LLTISKLNWLDKLLDNKITEVLHILDYKSSICGDAYMTNLRNRKGSQRHC
jgi:hypothetical protein